MSEMTQKFALSLFDYDPDTGAMKWRERPREHFCDESYWKRWNFRFAGVLAGCVGPHGYYRVNVNNKFYLNHRLIWLMRFGGWPRQIDRINGNASDNRLCNLRSVSATQNARNARAPTTNTSGRVGVSYDKRDDRWHAYIGVGGGQRKSLGYFKTKSEAIAARRAGEVLLGYHENHGRSA